MVEAPHESGDPTDRWALPANCWLPTKHNDPSGFTARVSEIEVPPWFRVPPIVPARGISLEWARAAKGAAVDQGGFAAASSAMLSSRVKSTRLSIQLSRPASQEEKWTL